MRARDRFKGTQAINIRKRMRIVVVDAKSFFVVGFASAYACDASRRM